MATDTVSGARYLSQAGFPPLPSGWDVVQVKDLLAEDRGISVGVMYPGDHDPLGIPLIKAGDLAGSLINPKPEFCITPEKHEEYHRTQLLGGEILMTLVGEVGQCAVVPNEMAGWNAARAIAVMRLRDPRDACFVRLSLLSKPIQHLMDVWSNTTVQPTLNLKEIKLLPLPWPPVAERAEIVRICRSLDDKIELNRRMNETLEAMARAIFKSWFVDFDPVRAKMEGRQPPGMDPATGALFPDRFEQIDGDSHPQGWTMRPLYGTAKFINGAAFKSADFCDVSEGLPVIKIAELKQGITSQTKFSKRNLDPKLRINTGDLLYSWSGSPDTSLDVFVWTLGPGLLNQHIFKVATETEAEKRFLYWLIKFLRPVLVEIARNKQTTGLGHVTVADMKRLKVCYPPDEVLAKFDLYTRSLYERVVLNTLESQSLDTVRDSLLPKLLSGEIRVTEADRIVQSAV